VNRIQQAAEAQRDSHIESDADLRQAWEKPTLARLPVALAEANIGNGTDTPASFS